MVRRRWAVDASARSSSSSSCGTRSGSAEEASSSKGGRDRPADRRADGSSLGDWATLDAWLLLAAPVVPNFLRSPDSLQAPSSDNRSPATGNRLRRAIVHLYAALHRWGESGWAGSAVGGWGVMQGSIVPGPSDALLIPLGLADPRRALVLAAWATAGATLGGIIAYTIGANFLDALTNSMFGWFGEGSASWESRRAQFESRGW